MAGKVWRELDADSGLALLEVPSAIRELSALSAAENHVAKLLAAGMSYGEIACLRNRSKKTVEHQVSSIFRKLGVGSRSELTARLASRVAEREDA